VAIAGSLGAWSLSMACWPQLAVPAGWPPLAMDD